MTVAQETTTQQLLSLADRAARSGVVDALLFRRLSATTWAHLGGLGRGKGWAGVVELADAEEPWLSRVPEEVGSVLPFSFDVPSRVLGPYYATAGALVRVSGDVVVLFGNPTGPLSAAATPRELAALSVDLDASVDEVAPSKRLADELEVLHAVRAVTTAPATDVAGTLEHIVSVAAASLSCEVGLVRDGKGRIAVTSNWPGVDPDDAGVGAALDMLEELAAAGSLCVQDTELRDVLAPLGRAQGVRSLLAVPIPQPVGGLLVVAHTSAGPRGFTGLCQQLGRQIADAAALVAATAVLRDDLQANADEQARTARCDQLTGLGNRLAWEEALEQAQLAVDGGGLVTILTLDVDGLKHVNDTYGHEAGDDLLRRCADVLREHGRQGDVCVRLGGDEFAVLMQHSGPMAQERLALLSNQLGSATSCARTVAASVGMASAGPGASLADAVREADAAMYAHKRQRRGGAREIPAQPARPVILVP